MITYSEIANDSNHLHNILKSLTSENKDECQEMIEILLKLGCNPNHFNAEHITPFEFLLDKIQNDQIKNDLIQTFLNNSIPRIEISDSEYNRSFVCNLKSEKLIIRNRLVTDIANLLELIDQGNEDEFVSMLQETELENLIQCNFTEIIKKCIEMNFVNGIKKLLQSTFVSNRSYIRSGCDIDSFIPMAITYKIDEKPLIFYAIKKSRPKIIKVFLDLDYAQFQNEPHSYSVLHEICSMNNLENDIDFQQCFNLIIKDRRCDYNLINGYDSGGKTPLMYACENDHKDIIYELLRRGAYIGHECIVNNLSEDIFKKVLDESIVPTSDISDQNCAVQINYKFLIPPKYSLTRHDETKALKLIASQPRFKNLMIHPVLTSYLELKWKRVNVLVYIALFLYFIFFVYLSLFILNFFSDERYEGNLSKNNESFIRPRDGIIGHLTTTTINPFRKDELENINVLKVLFGRKKRDVGSEASNVNDNQTNTSAIEGYQNLKEYIESHRIPYIICFIGTLILTFCEIIQLIFSWKTYFFKLSNLVDCALLYLAYIVLLNIFAKEIVLFKKLRAVLFLIISVQSFILLSRVSKLSLQLEIFKKVSKTFIKFIMLYFMLIFAFAMAFNTLYGTENADEKKKSDKDDDNGFQNILISVITVIRMMLSDFDKMKLEPDDRFNSVIFLTFVLLITIILFNLLNALAINDTQQIMKSAEIVDVRKRISIVGNCERILALLKVEFFNIYSNLIPNGQIIIKINKDNHVRVRTAIVESQPTEKVYIIESECIDMVPLSDESNKTLPKVYTKVLIPQLFPYEKLYVYLEKFNLLNLNLSLGIENIEKIINHVKYSIESNISNA
ncbi:unnamed protein product [Chironomus riparius]|uniref:Ion transport domain-containing protein n=1 Tax=Chironomus riparius TaxID=315576 RepID=A0A9P0NH48_9DIPT|nr:unnamed protein product [Chironomus riparius]